MLICAQPGGVTGSEPKTDPASSAKSSRKGFKDNKIGCWVSLTSFVSLLAKKSTISNTSELTGSKNRWPVRHKMRKNLDRTFRFEKILSLHKRRFAL